MCVCRVFSGIWVIDGFNFQGVCEVFQVKENFFVFMYVFIMEDRQRHEKMRKRGFWHVMLLMQNTDMAVYVPKRAQENVRAML